MQKRGWIITACICSVIVLLIGAYCILRFSAKIDILDQSGWKDLDGQLYYLDYYGKPVTGWQTVDDKTYYFDPETGKLHTGWLEQENCSYYLTCDGIHTGWLEEADGLYYLDETGVMQTGWQTVDGTRYYFDETGTAFSGWLEYEGSSFYLDEGALYTGWLEQSFGTCFFTEDGTLFTGWMDTENGKYYFDLSGVMQTGWQNIGEQRFFFREDGIMHTGWLDDSTDRYYLLEDGAMHTGWLEDGTDRYYFLNDGTMAVGQVDIDGTAAFFTSTGKYVLLVNRWHFMPEGYTPELVDLNGFQVDASCRDALEQMIQDCQAAGYNCSINNTYRSLAAQQYMWDVRLKARMAEGMTYDQAVEYIGQSLALVGASEHHLGLAVDLNGSDEVYAWLAEHCWDYGFILRYPAGKKEITGIIYEPWHFRYVGTELSKELQTLGLCMEEYMQQLTEKNAQ